MAEISLTVTFLTISGIILAGYLSDVIFRRFGIPHVLILLALGYVLGPFTGYLNIASLQDLQVIISTLALVILLFDGGLALDIYDVIHKSGRAVLMAFLEIILSAAACALVMNYLFGFNLWVGAIFGAMAGGTASQVIIPIAKDMKITDRMRQFFTLESSATDVLCVIATIVLVTTAVSGALDVKDAGHILLSGFSIGAVVGFVTGVLTIVFIAKEREKLGYSYMIFLGILILVYTVSEYFGGSGAVAALVFGIVLGNRSAMADMLKLRSFYDDKATVMFQAEVSFFVRTFFFVYMGTFISFKSFDTITLALAITGVLIVARFFSSLVSTLGSPLSRYRALITVMQSKGIALAVLALMPAIMLADYTGIDGRLTEFTAQFSVFPDLAIAVIVISIAINGVGVALLRNRLPPAEEDEKGSGQEEESKKQKQAKENPGSKNK